MALSFERGATSKERLRIDWLHPVPPPRPADRTVAAGPLPLAEALQVLWADDPRPLLVLRECTRCEGGDQALLMRSANNDRTLLLTRWFRAVRLPPHVVEPGHPFHNLFAGLDATGSVPHFYLLAHPGARPVEFTGVQTQSSLWQAMYEVLGERYGRDPRKAVKEWLALLDQFDRFDAALQALQANLDETRATAGPDSPRAAELQKRLADTRQQRAEALAREERVRDLGLLSMPKQTAAAPAGR